MIQFMYIVKFRILYKLAEVRKGDELPKTVLSTGGTGPARVWGHVKSWYSAGEKTEGPPCLSNHELT